MDRMRSLPPLHTLNHPIVTSFSSAFNGSDETVSRESITGLTNPHWWKQKNSRWRGAATDHSVVGEGNVWLCAAGLRAAGEKRDFYATFMRNIDQSGVNKYLPSESDQVLLDLDKRVHEFDTWKTRVHITALLMLAKCKSAGQVPSEVDNSDVPLYAIGKGHDSEPIASLSVSLWTATVEGDELNEVFLVAKILDGAKVKQTDLAVQIMRAALQPLTEEWRSTVLKVNGFAFSAPVDSEVFERSERISAGGDLAREDLPMVLTLGTRAHYAKETQLVDAQVEGTAVLSLCGYWFVPTADHETREECAKCQKQFSSLPR
jgi:hypothetical protein